MSDDFAKLVIDELAERIGLTREELEARRPDIKDSLDIIAETDLG